MAETPPRISILIPNFNNGRESSRSGDRDFIGDLFESLQRTLEDDPVPVEILVADDGSTDDSLETCRAWANRTWRGGQPFCRLFERAHTGVLSKVANLLTSEARGDICCRLDGDVVALTPRWASRLVETFETGPPDLGVVGPKQLTPDGIVHSMGDWILHPRGYHHLAQGALAAAVRRSIEVDHVMGCFYCHRRVVWEHLGGYDETILRGQTIDFGLRARLAGWRAFAVPDIEFVHAHVLRDQRGTSADTKEGIRRTLDRFFEKWGFDRTAPDLDEVRRRYAGTPLLWNARVFGPAQPPAPPGATPRDITRSEWARYAKDETCRRAVDQRVAVAEAFLAHLASGRRVLDVGCRAGLFCHLLTLSRGGRKLEMTGVDRDPQVVELARRACADQGYAGPAPRFVEHPDERVLPVESGAFDAVLLFDVLETHPNPVGLLREAQRALAPGGAVAIVTRARVSALEHEEPDPPGYRPHELVLQLHGSRCFQPVTLTGLPEIAGALVLFGKREADDAYPSVAAARAEPKIVPAAAAEPAPSAVGV